MSLLSFPRQAWEGGSLRAAVSLDCWGLGAVLWHIVTGEPLFPHGARGGASQATADLIRSAPIARPTWTCAAT